MTNGQLDGGVVLKILGARLARFDPFATRSITRLVADYHERTTLRHARDVTPAFRLVRNSPLYRNRVLKELARLPFPSTSNHACYHLIDRFFPRNSSKPYRVEWPDGFRERAAAVDKIVFVFLHQGGLFLAHAFRDIGISTIRPVENPVRFREQMREIDVDDAGQLPIAADALSLVRALRLLKSYRSILIALDHTDATKRYRFVSPSVLEMAARRSLPTCLLYTEVTDEGVLRIHASDIAIRSDPIAAAEELIRFYTRLNAGFGDYTVASIAAASAVDG